MQIDRDDVQESIAGQSEGIKVKDSVMPNYEVYKLK
jgi:hypothetical protein